MGQFVIFQLSEQLFGIRIEDVQEILDYQKITPVPYAPKFVKGIIDLRGEIVPVIELSKNTNEYSKHKLIVVSLQNQQAAILVSDVTEVTAIDEVDIRKPPALLCHKALAGIIKLNNQLVILLNVEKILKKEDLDLLKDISELRQEELAELAEET